MWLGSLTLRRVSRVPIVSRRSSRPPRRRPSVPTASWLRAKAQPVRAGITAVAGLVVGVTIGEGAGSAVLFAIRLAAPPSPAGPLVGRPPPPSPALAHRLPAPPPR